MNGAWVDEKEFSNVTVSQLESMCKEAFDMEMEVKVQQDAVDGKKRRLNELKAKIQAVLETHEKDSYDSACGRISRIRQLSVKVPKTEEEKKKFFTWVREQGLYWQYVNVNSRSLNSLYKSFFEDAKERGEDFEMPGIEPPSVYEVVKLTRRK